MKKLSNTEAELKKVLLIKQSVQQTFIHDVTKMFSLFKKTASLRPIIKIKERKKSKLLVCKHFRLFFKDL